MNVSAALHRIVYPHRSRAIDLLRGGTFSDQDLQVDSNKLKTKKTITASKVFSLAILVSFSWFSA